ncbi:MAG: PAS domain-containing sensor histidine kinase, partial [Vicinamibacteria bacterium]|nr:PAS domain-containing sensor histidine kinase [Vicinamibacteria bacterium]
DQVFTLKSADQTYRLMVEQMQKGAVTLSERGLVLYCNPFLAALLGVPLETLLGAPLSAFLEERASASLSALLEAAHQGVSRGEIVFKRSRNSVLTQVSVTALPLEGAPVFCMIVTDLTDRTRREAERIELSREQAARVAAEERNRIARAEIEERKRIEQSLREAEKERSELLVAEQGARRDAVEANRLKDEFLATLSHELRSPLSAILAWSHVLGQPGLDPLIATRAVEAIDRNARAQSRLVADLLDVSSIVTGQFRMVFAAVRLVDVIESAADAVRPAALAKNIRLDLEIDPEAAQVQGDHGRLRQVLWNLLSNAVKFAPVGGRVEVRAQRSESCIELSVTDDGPGINPAFLPYIFGRFRQADSSTTRGHAGLGLGLAIVRHLAELHGGTVEARNREGQAGASFIVRLPSLPDAAKGLAPNAPSRAPVAEARAEKAVGALPPIAGFS